MHSTIDAQDVANFNRIADQWWDEDGPFKPLHRMNPCRLGYIQQQVKSHFDADVSTLSLLDVGCGGGLLSEPLARMGFQVTALDAGAENIRVAMEHAQDQGLDIAYHAKAIEEFVQETDQNFDVITCLELIEHVADPQLLVSIMAKLLKPGGLLILSTLNRTAKSYLLGIGLAEYVLRWVPRGTHQWSQFFKPSEVVALGEKSKLIVEDIRGMTYNPILGTWHLSKDLDINYLVSFKKA